VFFTSHEYVERVRTFSQCVSLIGSNAWETEWFVAIQVLQNKQREAKKVAKNNNNNKMV
jgi:hypothetical protein